MLYNNAHLAANAAANLVQPQKNTTEIVFRCGTAEHMDEPFRSHLEGTLMFAIVHPSVVRGASIKEGVSHVLNEAFNFMGMQFLGEINTGKNMGVLHFFTDGSDPQQSYMEKFGATIARAWSCPENQLRVIRNDFGPGDKLKIPERMLLRMMAVAGIEQGGSGGSRRQVAVRLRE